MTRDSRWWWVGIATALVTGLTGNFNLLQDAFPISVEQLKMVNAWLQLIALGLGIISGKMSISPLNISSEGRAAYIAANAEHATKASVAADTAAIQSHEAAKVSKVAADAADVAVEESTKASGIQDP